MVGRLSRVEIAGDRVEICALKCNPHALSIRGQRSLCVHQAEEGEASRAGAGPIRSGDGEVGPLLRAVVARVKVVGVGEHPKSLGHIGHPGGVAGDRTARGTWPARLW